nr:MAG TPA: protein of unknown function DUF1287 [Caudoviricetes sp.]
MVEKFKFWCQKVLPTIYDDSLSYYEAICKMATYLDATIDQVNEFQKMIDALPETILNSEEFQKMVQDAVDGKIDALYKVVQETLDDFEARQASFEKLMSAQFENFETQVNFDNSKFKGEVNTKLTGYETSNAQFQQQVNTKLTGYETSNAQFQQQVNADNTKFKNDVNSANAQFKQEVNTKLTGYETSDAQFKKEVNTKLSGYETDNAAFKQQVNAKVDEIPKKIAEYPKYPLCQNSNGAVTNMFDVLMTYYHKDAIVYDNFKTPFNTNTAEVSAGKHGLDCSSLVQLCLMGVPYENTRWFNSKNAPTSGYYFGDDLIINPEADRPYGMLSDDMCKWFVEHGYYFETDDPTQLRPGDVVFMTFDDTSPNYKHVTHCNIFVSYQAITDELWCIGASNVTEARPFVVSRESYKRTSISFVGFGRLPLPDCEFNAKNLLAEHQEQIKNVSVQLSSTTHVMDAGRIRTPNSLEKNKVYTLVAKIKNATLPLYFTMQSGNTNLTNISLSDGCWVYVPFVLNFPNTPEVESTPLDAGTGLHLLSVYARTRSTETEAITRAVIFEKLALYEGVVISPIGETPDNPPGSGNKYEQQHVGTFNGAFTISAPSLLISALDEAVANSVASGLSIAAMQVVAAGSPLPPGRYLVFTYVTSLSNIKFGAQYIFGTTGGIWGRFANNEPWSSITKIAPYTPTT